MVSTQQGGRGPVFQENPVLQPRLATHNTLSTERLPEKISIDLFLLTARQ